MCGFIKSKYLFFNIKIFLKIFRIYKNSYISSIFPKLDEIATSFAVIFPKLDEILFSFLSIFDEFSVIVDKLVEKIH